MKAGSLIGMAVVSLRESTEIGQVEQPLFDVAARQLRALQVSGPLNTFIISFDQIDHIGTDDITITTSKAAQLPGKGVTAEGLLDLQALGRMNIVDQAGTVLGTLRDIDVDPRSGQITQITAYKGSLEGIRDTTTPIEPIAIVMVGPELLTVTTDPAIGAPVSSEEKVEGRLTEQEGTTAADRWADDGGDAQHP